MYPIGPGGGGGGGGSQQSPKGSQPSSPAPEQTAIPQHPPPSSSSQLPQAVGPEDDPSAPSSTHALIESPEANNDNNQDHHQQHQQEQDQHQLIHESSLGGNDDNDDSQLFYNVNGIIVAVPRLYRCLVQQQPGSGEQSGDEIDEKQINTGSLDSIDANNNSSGMGVDKSGDGGEVGKDPQNQSQEQQSSSNNTQQEAEMMVLDFTQLPEDFQQNTIMQHYLQQYEQRSLLHNLWQQQLIVQFQQQQFLQQQHQQQVEFPQTPVSSLPATTRGEQFPAINNSHHDVSITKFPISRTTSARATTTTPTNANKSCAH